MPHAAWTLKQQQSSITGFTQWPAVHSQQGLLRQPCGSASAPCSHQHSAATPGPTCAQFLRECKTVGDDGGMVRGQRAPVSESGEQQHKLPARLDSLASVGHIFICLATPVSSALMPSALHHTSCISSRCMLDHALA